MGLTPRRTPLEQAFEEIIGHAQHSLDLDYWNVSDDEQAELVLGMIEDDLQNIKMEFINAIRRLRLEKADLKRAE